MGISRPPQSVPQELLPIAQRRMTLRKAKLNSTSGKSSVARMMMSIQVMKRRKKTRHVGATSALAVSSMPIQTAMR